MNKQADPTNWAELIDDFKTSGQSMAAWCRAKNLKPYQLAYRLKKGKTRATEASARWLPVNLSAPGEAALIIKAGPALVRVTEGFDPVLLKQIVAALSSL